MFGGHGRNLWPGPAKEPPYAGLPGKLGGWDEWGPVEMVGGWMASHGMIGGGMEWEDGAWMA